MTESSTDYKKDHTRIRGVPSLITPTSDDGYVFEITESRVTTTGTNFPLTDNQKISLSPKSNSITYESDGQSCRIEFNPEVTTVEGGNKCYTQNYPEGGTLVFEYAKPLGTTFGAIGQRPIGSKQSEAVRTEGASAYEDEYHDLYPGLPGTESSIQGNKGEKEGRDLGKWKEPLVTRDEEVADESRSGSASVADTEPGEQQEDGKVPLDSLFPALSEVESMPTRDLGVWGSKSGAQVLADDNSSVREAVKVDATKFNHDESIGPNVSEGDQTAEAADDDGYPTLPTTQVSICGLEMGTQKQRGSPVAGEKSWAEKARAWTDAIGSEDGKLSANNTASGERSIGGIESGRRPAGEVDAGQGSGGERASKNSVEGARKGGREWMGGSTTGGEKPRRMVLKNANLTSVSSEEKVKLMSENWRR